MPGPCTVCSRYNTYCHFHPRIDARRKDCSKSQDKMRKNILCGILLALKLNTESEIQQLLQVLRSPASSASELARSIRSQLLAVSARCGNPALQFTKDDVLSLIISDMLNHKASSPPPMLQGGASNRGSNLIVSNDTVGSSKHAGSALSAASNDEDHSRYNQKSWTGGSQTDKQSIRPYDVANAITSAPPTTSLPVASPFADVNSYVFPFDTRPQNNEPQVPDSTTHHLQHQYQDISNIYEYRSVTQDPSHAQFWWPHDRGIYWQ